MSDVDRLIAATRKLAKAVDQLQFAAPVTHVYNPLTYARAPHEAYLKAYGQGPKKALFLGMNPGPFGMAQTGVPFGEVQLVREFLGIEGRVGKPPVEHPKRPVEGFSCTRSEVSGRRLWGAIAEHCGTPQVFFKDYFIANYCPLVFMEESGKNRTPDKLPAAERDALYALCDDYLRQVVDLMQPAMVIGVGKFAEQRAKEILADRDLPIHTVLHPSPASPKANAGWTEQAAKQLSALGLKLFSRRGRASGSVN